MEAVVEEHWYRCPVAGAVLRVVARVMPGVQIGEVRGAPSLLLIHGDRDRLAAPNVA